MKLSHRKWPQIHALVDLDNTEALVKRMHDGMRLITACLNKRKATV